MVQIQLKKKTLNFSFFKILTLNSIFVSYSSAWRGLEIITISSLEAIYSGNPQNFSINVYSFPLQHFVQKNVAAFGSNTKFWFLTSYDLQTTKLP